MDRDLLSVFIAQPPALLIRYAIDNFISVTLGHDLNYQVRYHTVVIVRDFKL
jgi:hypothetical protein